jgi:capsid protein
METLMTDTQTKVQQLAADLGMSFHQFAGRCLLRELNYDTARAVWNGEVGPRGFNDRTKRIVSKILRRPVNEVFDD